MTTIIVLAICACVAYLFLALDCAYEGEGKTRGEESPEAWPACGDCGLATLERDECHECLRCQCRDLAEWDAAFAHFKDMPRDPMSDEDFAAALARGQEIGHAMATAAFAHFQDMPYDNEEARPSTCWYSEAMNEDGYYDEAVEGCPSCGEEVSSCGGLCPQCRQAEEEWAEVEAASRKSLADMKTRDDGLPF